MSRKPRKIHQYRRQGKSLISANQISPENWYLTDKEIGQALQTLGLTVKKVKKIHYRKHQVCISWWDEKGNACSSFFSYRIFARWQTEVEQLINTCHTQKEFNRLSRYIQYELAYFPYPVEMVDAIATTLENREYHIKAAELYLFNTTMCAV